MEGISSILGIAFEVAAGGEARRATALLGAATEALARAGVPPWPALQAQISDLESRLRAALDQTDFAAAYEAGLPLSLDAAVTLALEQTAGPETEADRAG